MPGFVRQTAQNRDQELPGLQRMETLEKERERHKGNSC